MQHFVSDLMHKRRELLGWLHPGKQLDLAAIRETFCGSNSFGETNLDALRSVLHSPRRHEYIGLAESNVSATLASLRVIFPLLGKPPIASPFPTIVFWTSKMSGACCQGSFQRIADSSVSSRRKLHRAQPLAQQLVFFEKRVTESPAFR